MKNFQNYKAEKYSSENFTEVEDGIYKTKSPYGDEEIYVTSLSFEQETDCYAEEDGCPEYISQYPLEDILDEFGVYVTDFYDELNKKSEKTCYQEFGSEDLDSIKELRSLIGKRVYEQPYTKDGEEYCKMVIE